VTKLHVSKAERIIRQEVMASAALAGFIIVLALAGEGAVARLWAQGSSPPTPAPAVIPPAPDPRFPQVPGWKTELKQLAPNA